MFSSVTIGILVALSAVAWTYTKVQRRTGNNTKNSVIVSGMAGLFAFILVVTVMSLIDKAMQK
jgi:hypothetical protein